MDDDAVFCMTGIDCIGRYDSVFFYDMEYCFYFTMSFFSLSSYDRWMNDCFVELNYDCYDL